jgi:LAO/AO transport system kinase
MAWINGTPCPVFPALASWKGFEANPHPMWVYDLETLRFLAVNEMAFIRPSPSGGSLGGVARKTRETMLVCEAAGFDVIIVETVGVGQSETTVASMVDFFLVLQISGAGDELQGIKKGVLEVADAIVVNKADGDNVNRAKLAKRQYETALHLVTPSSPNWTPPVMTCSALEQTGLVEVWDTIKNHKRIMTSSGELDKKRQDQAMSWMWFLVNEGLERWFYQHPEIQKLLPEIKEAVEEGKMAPTRAADDLVAILGKDLLF